MKKQELGYIALWRQIKEKGWYTNSKYVHLWLHILLSANHKPKEFLWNGKNRNILTGQFITGRKKLSKDTGIGESTVERILACFESEQQIEQQKTSKFRLITVLNWQQFQTNEQHNGQQINNKRTTNVQQMDTNNNDNNDNNDNKRNQKKVWKDGDTIQLKDCVAIRRFGIWVDRDDTSVTINRHAYPEIP